MYKSNPQLRTIGECQLNQLASRNFNVVITPKNLKGGQIDPPPPTSIVLALSFCCLTDYQTLWYNCSPF